MSSTSDLNTQVCPEQVNRFEHRTAAILERMLDAPSEGVEKPSVLQEI